MDTHHIEICCNSINSAANAKAGGASRIELCQDLAEGGTTPSYATIKYCVERLHLDVFALIRPRSGDFCYNELEFQTCLEDIRICKELGAKGVVIGFLHEDGSINTEWTKQAVELARPLQVTFHRAFDECNDWRQALEDIIDCGCDRILTSGCAATAEEGLETLREIVKATSGQINILAGSGITAENVADIVSESGVREVHASCKHNVGYDLVETSIENVKQLLSITYEL